MSIILKFGGTKNFLAVAIVFLLAYDSFSQCGNENPTIQNVSKTSDMSKGAEARTLSGPPRFGSNDVLLIPIVVHVVWHNTNENIPQNQICSQIEILNLAFRNLDPDRTGIPAQFLPVSADTRIQFFLATEDPNGNPTNGITRFQTQRTAFSDLDNNAVKNPNSGGVAAWDPTMYLNIWICRLDGNEQLPLLGYSSWPWDFASEPENDGVVVAFDAFGTVGNLHPSADEGKVLIHELGHWFGLYHIWGNQVGCGYDDGIADTPTQENHYGAEFCPPFSPNSCGSNDMYVNYMDYTPNECRSMFSSGQVNVIRNVLNTDGDRDYFEIDIANVSGPNYVCQSNATYTVAGNSIPSYSPTNWQVIPSNLVNNSSGSGSSATFQMANYASKGAAEIIFRFNNATCAEQEIHYSRKIWIGNPLPVTGSFSGPTSVNIGTIHWYTVPSQSQEDGTFTWVAPFGFQLIQGGSGSNTARFWIQEYATSGYVQVWKTNSCGTGGAKYKYVSVNTGGGGCQICPIIQSTPNPASSTLNIKYIDDQKREFVGLGELDFTSSYSIIDIHNGNVLLSISSNKTSVDIDISSIKNGFYLLNVDHGQNGHQQIRIAIER